MTRPAVLIVEPDDQRRHDLGNGLASHGYEVAPASNVDEGLRFAQGLGPAVIVAPADLSYFGDASVLSELTRQVGGMERTLVLLGKKAADETLLKEDEVVFLAVEDLEPDELVRRLRLVLIGREIRVATDARLESLIGDLALKPLLELVRSLHRTRIHCRLELEDGMIEMERGEVVGAQAGRADGAKGFCRLARLAEAPFRVIVTDKAPSELSRTDKRRIEVDLNTLINAAIEDSMGQFPDPLSRLEIANEGDHSLLSGLEQQILQAARQGVTVQEVLDALDAGDGEIAQAILSAEEQGFLLRREPVTAVRVVTDSTADLPPELARDHGITILPLKLRFGQQVYRDRVDLQPRDFYRILEQKIARPESEPLSAEEIETTYSRVAPLGDVLALHVSSELSETHARAVEASLRVLDAEHRFEVVDSRHISMGLGLQALFAARMAMRGLDLDEIRRLLDVLRPRLVNFSVLETLDYLVEGGRVGKVQAFFQGIFDIKPILTIEDGQIAPVDKARGYRAAQPRVMGLLAAKLDESRPTIVAITHANSPVWADRMRQAIEQRFDVREMILTEAGPVIGAHVGPGTFGIVAFQPTDEELPLLMAPGELP